jgi:hypothetical protein
MLHCPSCGAETFRLGRPITIWQTLDITFTEIPGGYEVHDDQLHDTLEEGEIEEFTCAECETPMDKALLTLD